jgi:hypothetical protein
MKKIHILRKINSLIKRKATGSASEFASKLGLSRSGFFYQLKILKDDFEAPISFDRMRNSYYYTRDGELFFGFKEENQHLRSNSGLRNGKIN